MSLAEQALPTMVPVPLAGRADVGAQGVPSKVAEQLVMAAIPLLTTGRMGLPTMLMAPTVAGTT